MALDILSALRVMVENIKEYVDKKPVVSYGETQTLVDAEKAQARKNIGAASSYYELDLTELVTIESVSTEIQTFDISSAVDGSILMDAVNAGQIIRVHFIDNANLVVSSSQKTASVLLSDVYVGENVVDDTTYLAVLSGVHYNRSSREYSYIRLAVDITNDVYVVSLSYSPYPIKTYVDYAISNVSIVEIDTTLTESGKAADAKAVGDMLGDIATTLDTINGEVI